MGATKWEEGQVKVSPLEKGVGGAKNYSHVEGAHNKFGIFSHAAHNV